MPRGNEPLGEVANKFLFENHRVRVWNLDLAPGESSDWHVHDLDYVTIVIDPAQLRREADGHNPEDLSYPVGEVHFRPAEPAHRVTNIDSKRYMNVLIELKK